ncbi:MAG: hypothetical protein ACR2P8_12560 [Myxococcota bacterium]
MRVVPVLLVLAGLRACDPLVMIPGGELSGETKPVPESWAFTDGVDTVQLETRPDDPYSVNVWGVGVGKDFYVAAGKASNAWAQHIAADDRVRLRIEGNLYEMRAVRDDSPEARERFLAAAKAKYDFEPDPEQSSEATLFRLVAR